jgi:hypothetical protein
VAGSFVLAAVLALAVLAPLLAPYDWNATSQCRRLAPMSAEHWFGCDLFGRDILSRVMYGARFSLAMGISTVAVSLVFAAGAPERCRTNGNLQSRCRAEEVQKAWATHRELVFSLSLCSVNRNPGFVGAY